MEQNSPAVGAPVEPTVRPLPWGDIEAWLEVSDAAEIAANIRTYAAAEVGLAVAAERERAARVCDNEARVRSEAGRKQLDNEARDRCFAGARAALNCARGIRGGEVV